MRKIQRTQLLVGIALVTHLSFATHLYAFAVGDIEVHSHLGVPFMAEVPVLGQSPDRSVGVAIGSTEDYEHEGIKRQAIVDHLQAMVIPGAPDRIRIVSDTPMQASAFDLVLLVRAGKVTIVRHYAVGLAAPSAPAPVASAPAAVAAVQPKKAAAASRPVSHSAAPASPKPAWIQRLPHTYGPVRPGETLYRVMEELKIPKPVIWQVAVITWQTNQPQFSGGNMHGLMSGQLLNFPPDLDDAIATLDVWEAQRIVAEQWESWQALQRVAPLHHADGQPLSTTAAGDLLPAGEETTAAASPLMSPTPQPGTPLELTGLQTLLKGFEERLTQRLSVSAMATTVEPAAATIPFVNTTELQDSLRGLESRLLEQLQRTLLPHIQVDGARALLRSAPLPPSLQDMQTLVTPLLSSNTLLYVLVGQNILLFLLAIGFASAWYRSRKQQALATLAHAQTQRTRFIPVVHDTAVQP